MSAPHLQDARVDEPVPPAPAAGAGAFMWMLGPAFFLLAAWFILGPAQANIPLLAQAPIDRTRIVPGARRLPMGEPPAATVGGYSHACNECHRLFNSPPVEKRTLVQHTEIKLDHGMNDRCFNCHDRRNRERLVLHDGTLLGFDEVPRLCSQCHGTVYRDWQMGTHGKTMGSWNAASGKQHRLNCNDCHDPHAPAYKPIEPLPGPNTLRMGDQSPEAPGAEHERHIPLRRWSMPEPEAAGGQHEAPAPSAAEPAKEPRS